MQNELEKFLKNLGFREEDIPKIVRSERIPKNLDLLKTRVDFYKSFFHLNNAEVSKMVRRHPGILELDVSTDSDKSVRSKFAQYQKMLNLSESETAKMIAANPSLLSFDLLSDSPTYVKRKMAYLKQLLKLDDREVARIIISCPRILGLSFDENDPNSISSKCQKLKSICHANDNELRKMILYFPTLLTFKLETIQAKVNALKDLLGVDEEKAARIFVCQPKLFNLDFESNGKTSIKGKMAAFKNALNLDDNQVRKLVLNAPTILHYDTNTEGPSSFLAKIKKFQEIFPADKLRECIIQIPRLICVPVQKFKIRYMLAAAMNINEKTFIFNAMSSESKVWARFCHLKEIGDQNFIRAYTSEARFQKWYKVATDDLMEKHKLDKIAVTYIEHNFQQKTNQKIYLDKEELSALSL